LKKKEISKVQSHHSTGDVVRSLRSRSFTLTQITGVKNIERNASTAVLGARKHTVIETKMPGLTKKA
jgi:hypothetical protein